MRGVYFMTRQSFFNLKNKTTHKSRKNPFKFPQKFGIVKDT